MDTSTRILNYLMRYPSATAAELSRALDLTKADIHYHLRSLLKDGEIEVSETKIVQGAGRPARRFTRVDIPPLKLTRLVTGILMEELERTDTSNPRDNSLAERITQEILTCCPSTRNFSSSRAVRLNNLVDELKSFGFSFRWEAGKKGPQLFFDHEALSTILNDKKLVNEIIAELISNIQKETA